VPRRTRRQPGTLEHFHFQDLRKTAFSLSLRERARVRGLKIKEFFLFYPLIPTFSRREKE
jgi:hypothetical protein